MTEAIENTQEPTVVFPSKRLLRKNGPLYRQLVSILRNPIVAGLCPIGAALPKESQLADQFGISLITVRHAIQQLEVDGLIRRRAGKTAIVAAREPRMVPTWDYNSLADFVTNCRDSKLEIVSYRKERSSLAQSVFGLQAGESCYCLRAILMAAEQPKAQITIYLPARFGSQLKLADFDDVVVFRSVQARLGIRIAGGRATVRAELADKAVARALDYAEGSPVLVLAITFHAPDGSPVELSIGKYRADIFSISYDLRGD
jgi:GntR family transcriptional regulator